MKKEIFQFSFWDVFRIFLIPLLIFSVFVVVLKTTTLQNNPRFWDVSNFISVGVGFFFLAKKFKYYSILIGLVYLPAMYFLMDRWYPQLFVALFFGDLP